MASINKRKGMSVCLRIGISSRHIHYSIFFVKSKGLRASTANFLDKFSTFFKRNTVSPLFLMLRPLLLYDDIKTRKVEKTMICCICGTTLTKQTAHFPEQLGDNDLCCCADCTDKIYRTRPCVRFLDDLDCERFISPLDETSISDIWNLL